jgi:hypothetical protein
MNPALGWDISASAKSEKGEKIARVQILVNGATKYDKRFNPPVDQWQDKLPQQGQRPGENTSRLKVTNHKANVSETQDEWS